MDAVEWAVRYEAARRKYRDLLFYEVSRVFKVDEERLKKARTDLDELVRIGAENGYLKEDDLERMIL